MLTQEVTARSSSINGREPLSGAYFWLLAFFVVYCARPEDWIPGLRVVPLAKITGILALVALVLSVGQARRLPREVLYLFLLFAQLCLTVPFSPVWRGGAFNHVLEFSKVVVIVPVIVIVVRSLARLRWLILTQTASVFAVAMVSLVKGQTRGGRLESVLGGIYGNPNDLALAIVLTIPFCFAFMLGARSGFRKAAWFLAAAVITYTVFLTDSRGGLLALLVAMGVLLWEFGIKGERRYLFVLAGGLVLVGSLVAGAGLRVRLRGTFDSSHSAEDMSAYGSAVQRRQLLWRSLVVTAQHPLFGVGPGNFNVVSGVWRSTHNSFTEFSAEGGLPALILFLLLFGRSFRNVRDAERLARGRPQETLLAGALRSSLIGFVVGSLFASVEYHFFPYFLVAYSSALHNIAGRQKASEADSREETHVNTGESNAKGERQAITWSDYRRGRAATG